MVMTVIALRCTTLRVIVSRSEEKKEGAQGGAGGTSKGPGVRVQGPEWKAEDPAYGGPRGAETHELRLKRIK